MVRPLHFTSLVQVRRSIEVHDSYDYLYTDIHRIPLNVCRIAGTYYLDT
jgi:hypothetical protein